MAIEVDKDGRMVKVENGVTTYVPTGQQQQWQAAVQAAMQRNGTTDASNMRFLIAEPGDSQWTMSHQVGSPWSEMTASNNFANDDLILVGEAVAVPAPTPEGAAALGPEGRDAFAQSIETRANHAANADSGTAMQQWDGINADIGTYLKSVPQDDFVQATFDLVGYDYAAEGSAHARSFVVDQALDALGSDKGAQQQMVDQLLAQKWPVNGDDIKQDVTQAAQKRGLKTASAQAPAQTQAPADPRLTAIQTAADCGDRGQLRAQISNFIGQVNGADNAAAFKALTGHDWGKSSPAVMEELYNAVVQNLNHPTPAAVAQGGQDPVPGNKRQYIKNYLAALDPRCLDLPQEQRQYREQLGAADKLSQQTWDNPDYTKPEVKQARAEFGLPEK
ncbi:hypothetical protein [Inquilinus limosus]|uniref:LysM domain-containing protein n=1 Tax=Inquilinus limosus TaxID=171674 RepID=A0A211ZJY6_9PROT|nr:hypothetical protein [Inquilinus limosus]OWJ65588.1 hypothetical protein BWR60_18925 [Inquilinus limosus]